MSGLSPNASVSVLRFRNARSAFVLSASGTLSRFTTEVNGGTDRETSQRGIYLGLGLRRHTVVAPRVLAQTELGVFTWFNQTRIRGTDAFGAPTVNKMSNWNMGAYGEIGGQYFVASHLALGAAGTLSAGRMQSRTNNNGLRERGSGFAVTTALTPIRITLYF